MPRLFSYCIPGDDGAAPNPYGPILTLNICKPVIRRVAQEGDWVVGTGSMQFGFENKVVYAMEITKKMTMEEYWHFCNTNKNMHYKIPNWDSKIYRERVGDSIYDFSTKPSTLLPSVHNEGNRPTDEGGECTLLSDHFYYFGSSPESFPEHLLPIVKQGQAHRSTSNDPYYHSFIEWITTHIKAKNTIYAPPQGERDNPDPEICRSVCAARDRQIGEIDEATGDEITDNS